MMKLTIIILIAVVALLLCCIAVLFLLAPIKGEVFSSIEEVSSLPEEAMSFQLTSTAFTQGNSIPARYTCTDINISPPLAWGDPPVGTQSFALIMDDPDAPAGAWVHWIIYNIPASSRGLTENVRPDTQLADGSLQWKNSWGKFGYGGPCPPSGTHRYFFKLYALDTVHDLKSGASKSALLATMEGHILGYAELMGTYAKWSDYEPVSSQETGSSPIELMGTYKKWANEGSHLHGEPPDVPLPWDVERMNAGTFALVKDKPLPDMMEEFNVSYRDALALIHTLSEEQLRTEYTNIWPMGPLWLGVAANTFWHYKQHRESIEAWLQQSR